MATNLQFVKSESADSVSSLSVLNMFSAQYDVYEVFVRGNGSASVGSLSAEFLDSGGSDIAQGAYDTAILRLDPTTSFGEVRTTNANSFEFAYPSATDHDFAVKFTVFNPYSSSSYTFTTIQSMAKQGEKAIAVAKSTTSAEGMKFYANQNYTPINVSVYGVK
jgi:hypothetical protein